MTEAPPKRGRGRPKSAVTKQFTSIRLDPDVIAKLRETAAPWQTEANRLLRKALGLDSSP